MEIDDPVYGKIEALGAAEWAVLYAERLREDPPPPRPSPRSRIRYIFNSKGRGRDFSRWARLMDRDLYREAKAYAWSRKDCEAEAARDFHLRLEQRFLEDCPALAEFFPVSTPEDHRSDYWNNFLQNLWTRYCELHEERFGKPFAPDVSLEKDPQPLLPPPAIPTDLDSRWPGCA